MHAYTAQNCILAHLPDNDVDSTKAGDLLSNFKTAGTLNDNDQSSGEKQSKSSC